MTWWRGGVFLSVLQMGYPVRRHLNYFSSWVSFTRHSGSGAKSLRRGLRSRKTFLSVSNFNARWRYNLNADALLSLRKLRYFSTCFCLHMTSGLYAPSLVLAEASLRGRRKKGTGRGEEKREKGRERLL